MKAWLGWRRCSTRNSETRNVRPGWAKPNSFAHRVQNRRIKSHSWNSQALAQKKQQAWQISYSTCSVTRVFTISAWHVGTISPEQGSCIGFGTACCSSFPVAALFFTLRNRPQDVLWLWNLYMFSCFETLVFDTFFWTGRPQTSVTFSMFLSLEMFRGCSILLLY